MMSPSSPTPPDSATGSAPAILQTTILEQTIPIDNNPMEAASTAAKNVCETFKDALYVKAVAELVLRIIKIREGIKTEDNRSQELIDKILRKSNVIFGTLLQIAGSPVRNQLEATEQNVQEYNILLEQVCTTLTEGKFDSVKNRDVKAEVLAKYGHLVDDFSTDFVTTLLGKHTAYRSSLGKRTELASSIVLTSLKGTPLPDQMIGRDEQKSTIIGTLLNHALPRIAILGAGGMGKTTLALTTLHDPAVIEQYPSRYFIPCEAIKSLSVLIHEIANSLHIPPAERNENLMDVVLSSFHEKSILCLDNLETIWEDNEIRPDVEDFLSRLDSIPQLAIIVTMRGTERPSKVSWSKPLLQPLEKLNQADARSIFEITCGPVDGSIEKLLGAIDGIPLAIKLISAQLQEGLETSESLLSSWERIRTSAIGMDSSHRLSNLNASIHLSVYSHRMRENPNAIPILVMLSSLPDGFPYREEAINDLQTCLPDNIPLRHILPILRRVSLVYIDETGQTNTRIRMLEPIRQFCRLKLDVANRFEDSLVEFYIKMMDDLPDVTSATGHAIVPSELSNMHTVISGALNNDRADQKIITASIRYADWCVYTGNTSSEIMELATRKTVGSLSLHAQCLSMLSFVRMRGYKLEEAESSFKRAIELLQQVHDVLGEANAIRMLGQVYLGRNKLDEAESNFKQAVSLHRQVNDLPSEANDVHMLGQVYLQRHKLDDAESCFNTAIQLHRQVHDVLGEATDVQMLGDVHMRRNKLEEAESALKLAISLHRRAHSVLSEADVIQMLGRVCLQRGSLDEAESSFNEAIERHRKAQGVLGEGYDAQGLGEVYLQRGMLIEAASSLNKAIGLHRRAHSVLGEAGDFQLLGQVHLRCSKLDEAEASFNTAIKLHRQANSVLGEAKDLQMLGEAYFRRYKLDSAESSFKTAIELRRQVHDILGEANGIHMLGEVYLRRYKLDEAESSFSTALALRRQVHDVLGEASDTQMLGQVYLRRNKLDEAESAFKTAIGLHRQVHAVLDEANDFHTLGQAYLQRYKLDQAEQAFKTAVELHRQVHDVLGEANSVGYLGNVYLGQGKVDEAESSFKLALDLHRRSHSVLGEAGDLQMLGTVHLIRNKLDEAESSFELAIELHRQGRDVLGEANDVRKLGSLYLEKGQLEKAESSFKMAGNLHQRANDVRGEGIDVALLGEVYLRWDKLDEAESSFNSAIKFHSRARDVLGEADNFRMLGIVYLGKRQLHQAEQCLNRALLLHRQCQDSALENMDLRVLAEIRKRRESVPTA